MLWKADRDRIGPAIAALRGLLAGFRAIHITLATAVSVLLNFPTIASQWVSEFTVTSDLKLILCRGSRDDARAAVSLSLPPRIRDARADG